MKTKTILPRLRVSAAKSPITLVRQSSKLSVGASIAILLAVVVITANTSAQTASFAGAPTILPFTGLYGVQYVVIDGAGDIFVADSANNRILELRPTATGYEPQITLPFTDLDNPIGLALDSAGDVFVTNNFSSTVFELPKTATGYDPQITLPFTDLDGPGILAVDSAGNVIVADDGNNSVLELPKTTSGYGPQETLPFYGLNSLRALDVDSVGDVFLADSFNSRILELPKTSSGYGSQETLPLAVSFPWGVALDGAGDLFIGDWGNDRVVELPRAGSGYGSQITLPFRGLAQPYGVGVDSAGNVYAVDGYIAEELQTGSVNFRGANVCAPGDTAPSCSETIPLTYNIGASNPTGEGVLGTPKVLTNGQPNLDFTLASGNTCTGTVIAGNTCTVNITFAPLASGVRNGTVEIVNASGTVLATTAISGIGLPGLPPHIATVNTRYGAPYSVVYLTGTNFGASKGSSTVAFDGTAAPIYHWADTDILVTVPGNGSTGNLVVTVDGKASNAIPFTVLPMPRVTGITPTSGPIGTVVTISGENLLDFENRGAVTFNGKSLPILSQSSTALTVEVPAGAVTGDFHVLVNDTGMNTPIFTVTP